MNEDILAPSHAISQKAYDLLQSIHSFSDTLDFERLAQDIIRLFWELYADRPDVSELCEWVTSHEELILEYGRNIDLWGINTTLTSFLRLVARSNNCSDFLFSKIDELDEKFKKHGLDANFSGYGECIDDFIYFLFECAKSNNQLPVTLQSDAVRIGRHCQISFNRTLRIPEDGKDYPLPAGFGRLPICRVEDYADKVPAKWLQEGGFFIPLYQKEALFLEFEGAKWRPCAVKVAVGRVNAVTGDEYDEKIRTHRQDYLVVPDQKWLDGINSGEGRVGQFVAMPLGKGYTIEAQVTDEEVHGGFQVVVFDPRLQRFPNEDPDEEKRRQQELKRRKEAFERGHAARAGVTIVCARGRTDEDMSDAVEMGIAKGGSITQEIIEDTYGADSWDENNRGSIVIRLVNSLVYQQITGNDVPPTPITAEAYAKYNIPWFDAYDENALALNPGKAFQYVKSIATLEKIRGEFAEKDNKSLIISPERLRKLQTPNKQERVNAFIQRAQDSLRLGLHAIAHRESSCALDLLKKSSDMNPSQALALQIRGEANLALGRFSDAEGDASDCLDLDYANISALSTRAQALFKMGENRLAVDDAKRILRSQPNHGTGQKILIDCILLRHLTRIVQNVHDAEAALQSSAAFFQKQTPDFNRSFIVAVENQTIHPNHTADEISKTFREIDDQRSDVLRNTPNLNHSNYILNYYPNIWEKNDIDKAQKFYQHKLVSNPTYMKYRTIPDVAMGIEDGLHLGSDNPIHVFLSKWWEMDKCSAAQKVINELEEIRLALPIQCNVAPPNNWLEIDRRLTYVDNVNSSSQLNLLGNSPSELSNLFATLTPEQVKEVKAKEAGLLRYPQGEGSDDDPESFTIWAPAYVAKVLNEYLTPGHYNYNSLKLVSGSVQLPESPSGH